MAEILPEIFNRSLSLETGGEASGKDPVALWERMAKSLDEIAANTRRGYAGGGAAQGGGKTRAATQTQARAATQAQRERRSTLDDSGSESLPGRRSSTSRSGSRRKAVTGRHAGGGATGASGSPSGRTGARELTAPARGGVRGLGPTVARVAAQAATVASTAASTQAAIRAREPQRDAKGRFTSSKTRSAQALERMQEARAEEQRQKTFFGRLKEACTSTRDEKRKGSGEKNAEKKALDAAGMGLGGPFYAAAKELYDFGKEIAGKDSFMGRMVTSFVARGRTPEQEAGDDKDDKSQSPVVAASDPWEKRAENKAQAAQSRYQQRTDRASSARDMQNIEIAADSFELQREEARQDAKRHKELVKAVKSVRPSLLGRALGNRLLGGRGGRGRPGRDGRVVARGGGRAARGGLLGGAGGLLRGAGAALRVLGPAAALLFAGMGAVDGWNDKELHQKAFGLKDGQEASTGQKVAASAASVLDMGGLLTGAANLFGFDIDTADIARGLYNTASAVGDFFKQLSPETLLAGAKTVMASAIDMGKRAFDGVTDFVASLDLPGKAMSLVGAVGDLGSRAINGIGEFFGNMDLTGTISSAATAAWDAISGFGSKLGEAVSSFFGDIDIAGTLKEAATGAWDTVKGGASKLADGFMSLFSGDDKDEKKTAAKEAKKPAEKKIAQQVAQKEEETAREERQKRAAESALARGASPEAQVAAAVNAATPIASTAPQAESALAAGAAPEMAPPVSAPRAPVQQASSEESVPVELSQADQQAIAGPLASTYEISALLNETIEKLTAVINKDYQLREREFRLNTLLNPEAAAMLGLTDALNGFSFGGGGYGGGYGGGGGSYSGGGSSSIKYDPNAKLGSYFVKYESGDKGVDAIGYDSGGGTSYGKYQFAAKVGGMQDLLDYMESKGGEAAEAAKRIRAAGPLDTGSRSGAAVDAYKAEIARNREMMEQVQDEFAFNKYYAPALSGLSPEFQKRIEGNRALQEVLFSSSIQHGVKGAKGIFQKAMSENANASDEDLLHAIFQLRAGRTGRLNGNERAGVLNRYAKEEALYVQLSRSQRRVEAFQKAGESGGQTALDAQVSMGIQDMTEDAIRRGVKYQMGGKNSFSGEGIDCSGWIYETNVRLMKAINEAAGEVVYDDKAFAALRQGHNKEGAAGLIRSVYEQTGEMVTNEALDPSKVRAGMMIGLDTGRKDWDGGRFMGIDHIVQTFIDEATGEMMVSESRGDKGVMISRYADWYARYEKSGARMYGVDPALMADASKIQAKAAEQQAQTAEAQAQTAAAQAQTAQAQEAAMQAAGEQQVQVAEAVAAQQEGTAEAQGQAQEAQTVIAQAAETPPIPAAPVERAETVAPPSRVEEVGQIAPPTQSGTNRQLELAGVEGLLREILKAIQLGFGNMPQPSGAGQYGGNMSQASGAGPYGGPNIAMDFDDAAAREVANS